MSSDLLADLQGSFGVLDWSIVAAVLALSSWIGLRFGKTATIREFFLGGRKLPWWAVSASIVATEISAVTLVSVPAIVFKPGGNFMYLQLPLIGSILARAAIAWWLVPAYYEREILSPYDFMGRRLGEAVRRMASCLFALGGMLSQAARVYVTALVLEIVLHDELAALAERTHVPTLALSIGMITAFACLWTWIGGVASVIWTDVLLFIVFSLAGVAVVYVIAAQPGLSYSEIWRVGVDSQRMHLFDFDTSPARAYTLWAAVLAISVGNVSAYGVDQLMAQRILCCDSVRSARKALLASSVAVLVTVVMAFAGVALAAYYEHYPLQGSARALYEQNPDRILPIFLTEVVPVGLKGLIAAGIFAAAISSLDAILAALSQTTYSALYQPLRERWLRRRPAHLHPSAEREERRSIRVSRILVVVFGIALAAISFALDPLARRMGSVLDMALSMAGYTQGALLAGFLMAYLRAPGGGSGYLWAAPFSMVWVFVCAWHGSRSETIVDVVVVLGALAWIALRLVPDLRSGVAPLCVLRQAFVVACALASLVWVQRHGVFLVRAPSGAGWTWLPLAFPWYVPAGCCITFVLGLCLARDPARRAQPADVPAGASPR